MRRHYRKRIGNCKEDHRKESHRAHKSVLSYVVIMASLICGFGQTSAKPPLDVYGALPSVEDFAISPDGQRFAYLVNAEDGSGLIISDWHGNRTGTRTDNLKTRGIAFNDSRFVILGASDTARWHYFRGRTEYTGAFSYDFQNNKIRQLLAGNESLWPAQSGLGRIAAYQQGSSDVYMPAYLGTPPAKAKYGVMKVNLQSGKGRVHERGKSTATDWLVNVDGSIIAREEYNEKTNQYTISVKNGNQYKEIFRREVSIPYFSIHGLNGSKSAIIMSTMSEDGGIGPLSELSFDGKLSPIRFTSKDFTIDRLILDRNRTVLGAQLSGLLPSYEFFNDTLDRNVARVQNVYASASTTLVDTTDDFSILIFLIQGDGVAPAYYRFDAAANQLARIVGVYADIEDKDVANVSTVEYRARDGLKITAIVTRPRNWTKGKAYPTIMLPHGGPATYDAVGFDWLAQSFASRGYLVMQPNFRGSWGFGNAFMQSGYGEWGRGSMQHDITDGLKRLIEMGWTDPNRVCIIGASYGGYAALAGGAFTPDLYACIGAIAPVSDLPRMIYDEVYVRGRDNWVVEYWKQLIGDPRAERSRLNQISPAKNASSFKAPVLLLHGSDDTVVPYRHSQLMESALRQEGKTVKLVRLKGEDHWLSLSETRTQTLKELHKFVGVSIGPGIP